VTTTENTTDLEALLAATLAKDADRQEAKKAGQAPGFVGVYAEKLPASRGDRRHWVAIWRTRHGFIHDTMNVMVAALAEDDARAHALAHPPTGTVAK
jgi:hypothetical protein